MKRVILISAFLFSTGIFAENPVTGKIRILHTNTTSSGNTLASGFTEIQLVGKSFDSPCGWVHLRPEDKNALSLLLSAQAQNREVKIYYHPDAPSPWAPGSCAISAVQIATN